MGSVNNIYIVGFMGTGKTAVGKQTAMQLNRKFLDLDAIIEARQNKKITQIFAQEGEAYFRSLEKQALGEVAAGKDLVVSCGGGIVIDQENIGVMKQTGVVICLSARPDVILSRTNSYSHRPLLNVDNPLKKIEELLKVRAPFYAKADYTIDSSDLKISEVVNRILDYVGTKSP